MPDKMAGSPMSSYPALRPPMMSTKLSSQVWRGVFHSAFQPRRPPFTGAKVVIKRVPCKFAAMFLRAVSRPFP